MDNEPKTEIAVAPVPLNQVVPQAALDLRFNIDGIVAIGVEAITAEYDTALQKIVGKCEEIEKDLKDLRRDLDQAVADHGCPTLKAKVETLVAAAAALGDSIATHYEFGEVCRETRTYRAQVELVPVRNSRKWEYEEKQALTDAQAELLDQVEEAESHLRRLENAASSIRRASRPDAIKQKVTANAATYVFSKSEDGKQLVESIKQSVLTSDDILTKVLPNEQF